MDVYVLTAVMFFIKSVLKVLKTLLLWAPQFTLRPSASFTNGMIISNLSSSSSRACGLAMGSFGSKNCNICEEAF